MREITRELSLPIDAAATFEMLITPSAIRAWWSAARVIVVPRQGGLWVAAWGDDENVPDFVTAARLKVYAPPTRLTFSDVEYDTKQGGLPFDAELETDFVIRPAPSGGSVLRVTQTGFPEEAVASEFYSSCQTEWDATLQGIERYVASIHGAPAGR